MSLLEVAQFVAGGLELFVRQNICFKEARNMAIENISLRNSDDRGVVVGPDSDRPNKAVARLGFVRCLLLLQTRRVLPVMTCLLCSLLDPMTMKSVSGKPGAAYARGQSHGRENLE